MSIANSDMIKVGVSAITLLIEAINKLTAFLPGPIGGLAKLGLAIGAFKGSKFLINGLMGAFGTEAVKSGTTLG